MNLLTGIVEGKWTVGILRCAVCKEMRAVKENNTLSNFSSGLNDITIEVAAVV